MKCIYCEVDCKKKERPDGCCPGCKHRFAFDPANGDPFTDMAFKAMIDRVSVSGSVRWGKEHLFYELARKFLHKRSSAAWVGSIAVGVAGLVTGFIFGSPVLPLLGTGLAVGAWYKGRSPFVPLTDDLFETYWKRWRDTHPLSRGVIDRPPGDTPPRQVLEADMAHYSFDRAVICDRARTVDLLLANNFHFENNCAVLGVKGYPKATFELVRKMLRQNPRLQVFVLHDATPEGCNLARHLAADPAWFRGIGRVVDVGIRPHHAAAFKGAFRKPAPLTDTAGLLPGEAEWLSKQNFELAAIRPEQVIKRLFKAMSAQPTLVVDRPTFQVGIQGHHDSTDHPAGPGPDVDAAGLDVSGSWDAGQDGSGSWGADMDSFGGDATASDGGGDSFG
ncbi:MAG: hypothetical protein JWM80_3009 [Cyanobacteria bacterium RYN_339]|nr:hypothetical protein [Cyanobacteria bacterium RYN_339]